MVVKITQAQAVELFVSVGMKTADKWTLDRLGKKLAKIDEMVDDDLIIEDEEIEARLVEVLSAIEDGVAIEIKKSKAKPKKETKSKSKLKPKPKKAKKETKPKPKPKVEKETKPKPKPKVEKETKPKPKPKVEKETKPKKEKKPKSKSIKNEGVPVVRLIKSRPFLAGVMIAEQDDLEIGITQEMVAELDERYGRSNPIESFNSLKFAWLCVRGYVFGESDVD